MHYFITLWGVLGQEKTAVFISAGIYKRFKVMYNNNMENQAEIEKIKGIIATTLSNKGIDSFEIFLFGSRARGDFSSKSDYDFLIILKNKLGMKDKIKLFTQLRRLLAKQRYNVDIVIKSAEEANYYKNKVGHIVRNALKEGIAI